MILLIFGIYAMLAAKLQITRHYGLKGKGARIAGGVCIVFALVFIDLFDAPIAALSKALGLGEIGETALQLILQFVGLLLVLYVLVRKYGNAFAKTQAPPPLQPQNPGR